MKVGQRGPEGASRQNKTLWQQLTPQQREQIAVVMLRIVRQGRNQRPAAEVEDESVE
jgi:hypothetical protein